MHELYLSGRLVVREPFAAIGHQGLSIDGDTRHDERLDLLAHALRRNADDRRLDDRRIGGEHLFNVAWIDVEATANDQILLALKNVEVAIFFYTSHIADIHPALAYSGSRGFAHVVVGLHYVACPSHHLAGL